MQDLHDAPPVEALEAIQEFLRDNEKRLCKEVSARDIDGRSVTPHNKNAISWCIEGLYYMLGLAHNMSVKYLHEAVEKLYSQNLIWVNDNLGYHAISDVLDEAILTAKEIEDAIVMN